MPPLLHIVGRQNHGKTTFVVELVRALTNRGFRVGTIKHSGHQHEFDTPGKDSHQQRVAGAKPAAVVGASLLAIFETRDPDDDPYARLLPHYQNCDIVLIEGGISGPGPKLEVWRAERGTEPMALQYPDANIVAVISDDSPQVDQPIWRRSDGEALATNVVELLKVDPS
jgi:molybdopterin-guanine dinucleotide biosynthesis adapter protein